MVKTSNYGHIRDQQVKIYKNSCFVLNFTSFEFLTVFSTAVLTGSWWRRPFKLNSKHRKHKNFSNPQLQENWMKNVAMSVRFIVSVNFWPLFSTEITVKTTNHGHIRDQRVKIYKNPSVVLSYTSLKFLTGFSTAISTRSWWRRKLKWNRKQCHNSIFLNFQFQENRIKTVAVRVPVWKHAGMAAVTSSIMLMSQNMNAHH